MIRPDQIKRLQQMQDKLMDRYIDLVDPDGWPQAEPDDEKSARNARGDRVWIMKEANQVGVAIVRNEVLMGASIGRSGADPDDEATGEQIVEAMAEAEAIIANAKGTRFGPRRK